MTEIGKAGLQAEIAKLLDRLGIVYIRSRTDKRSTNNRGTPDFIFAIASKKLTSDCACAWEVKLPKKKLRPEQQQMLQKLQTGPNAWRYCVITSVDEAIAELKAIGMIQ